MPISRIVKFEEFTLGYKYLIIVVAKVLEIEDYYNIFISMKREYDLAKYVCYYVCREKGFSLPRVGKIFNRHHSSILCAIRQLDLLDKDKKIRKNKYIKDLIKKDLSSIKQKDIEDMLNFHIYKEYVVWDYKNNCKKNIKK